MAGTHVAVSPKEQKITVLRGITLQGPAYQRFLRKLTANQATSENYHDALLVFMKSRDFTDVSQLLLGKAPEKLKEKDFLVIEDMIIDFIQELEASGVQDGTVRQRIEGVRHFYEMNRVTRIAWRSITATIRKTKKLKKRGYRDDEIIKAIEFASPKGKTIISTYACTGMRETALSELNISDAIPLENYGIDYHGFLLIVYRDTDDEYYTFTTEECRRYIEAELEYRRSCGEELKPSSPLFRQDFNKRRLDQVNNPKRLSADNAMDLVKKVLIAAGIRKTIKLAPGQRAGRIRHEVKLIHGFRMMFDTKAKNVKMDADFRKFLMGHDCGLDENYYDYQNIESVRAAFEEYKKVANAVTFMASNKLAKENQELKQELEKAAPRDMIADLMLQQKQALDKMDAMQRQIFNQQLEIVRLKQQRLQAAYKKPKR